MWEYNYLEHANGFKYLKKVKKDGKWRYIYDVKQLQTDVGIYDRKRVVEQRKKVEKYGDDLHSYANQYFDMTPEDTRKYPMKAISARTLENQIVNTNAKYKKAGEEYYKKLDIYHATPLGKIDKKVRKAQDFIEKLFKNDNIFRDFKKPGKRR